MNIAEAVEIVRNGGTDCEREDAYATLAYEYLHYFDPTPLTVEVIEKELGVPVSRHGGRAFWMVGDRMFSFRGGDIYVMNVVISRQSTLGHLRQVVAMMKGGV